MELAALVAQAVEAVRPLFDEHHQALHVSIPEESIFLKADPTRLEQILFNLLINAAKYTHKGGESGWMLSSCRARSSSVFETLVSALSLICYPRSSIFSYRENGESAYLTREVEWG